MKVFGLSLLFLLISPLSLADEYIGKGKIKALYNDKCSACHGKNMEGGMAKSLLDDHWTYGGTDAEITKSIRDGIDGSSMPGWSDSLSKKEIRALVILIREQAHLSKNKPSTQSSNGVYKSKHHNFKIKEVAQGTNRLWGLDFYESGDMLVTQRSGILWRFSRGQRYEVAGIPQAWHHDQGGLLDVAIHPDNPQNPWVYLAYSDKALTKKIKGKAVGSTTIARGKIVHNKWTKHEIVFQIPEKDRINRGWHYGSRIVFKDGYVFFSSGDEGYPEHAQDITRHNGKIHRIHEDGRIPQDNPYAQNKKAFASIWTLGNRNPQGLDVHPQTGDIWEAEHGPRGGDEINLISKRTNYGWPTVTYGMNYDGSPLTDITQAPGMEQPKHYWVPSIAVCGIEFYEGNEFSKWKNNLFAGGLGAQQLHRLEIKNNQVVEDEILLKGMGRVRDIANGPDGGLYVILNSDIYRVVQLIPN